MQCYTIHVSTLSKRYLTPLTDILAVIGVFYVLWALISFIISLFNQNQITGTKVDLSCPRCGSEMILRNGKRGKFYGCPRFPRCRGTRDYVPEEAETGPSLGEGT